MRRIKTLITLKIITSIQNREKIIFRIFFIETSQIEFLSNN